VAGDPPSNSTCNQGGCHNSFVLNSGGGTLSLSGVPFNNNNYTPGQTYDLTVNLRHVGKSRWGFELTALDSNNNRAGTIIVTDSTNTQLSDKYLKHRLSGAFFNPDQSPGWNFQWKAPSSGIPVIFYVAGNAANGDGSNGGDQIYSKSFPLSPAAIPSATTSQITATSPVVADGISTSTITVTVRDASGNPISGKNVTIAATGSGNTITQPSSPTDASGQTTASIKSTKAETKTITATVDSISIQTAVTFFSPAPPVIALVDTTFTATVNTEKLFKLQVTTDNAIPAGNVKLFYKSGEQAFASSILFDDGSHSDGAAIDGVWANSLAASLVSLKGLSVYFTATDDRGNSTDTITLSDGTKISPSTPANVVVTGDVTSPAIPVWLADGSAWTMTSFPVTLPNIDPAVVFAELGAVETNWQAYQFNGGSDYDRAIKISRPGDPRGDIEKFNSIGSGKAAWLYHDKTVPTTVTVKGAKSLDITKVFALQVRSGWNQIGNPFLFSIPWNNMVKFGTANNLANALPILTAASNNQVANPPLIYLRSGSGYTKISAEPTPSPGTVSGSLEAWKGYWFLAKTDGFLFIDPNQATPSSTPAAPLYNPITYNYNNITDLAALPLPPPPPSPPDSIRAINHDGISGVSSLGKPIVKKTELRQNFPNPFNPETWIPYQLSEAAEVSVEIYDIHGRLVRQLNVGRKPAGIYLDKGDAVYWDGKNQFGESVSSGVYFYKLKAGSFTGLRKMVVIK
jgi:hypothetical protein